MLHNLFLLDLSVFNELLLKNDPVKKTISFSVFVEGFRMPHDQVLVLEDKTLHCKVLSRLYCNNTFNTLANFNPVFPTS